MAVLSCLMVGTSGDAPALSIMPFRRSGKSLVNQFPFNQGDHHGHHGHHEHHDLQESRFAKQRAGEEGEEDEHEPLDIGTIAAAGQRCVEKVMMVEETVYDDAIECHHSYDKRCHTTFTTDYVPQQVEDCDENFVKECHIEYKKVAFNETVEICNEKPTRDCEDQGNRVL